MKNNVKTSWRNFLSLIKYYKTFVRPVITAPSGHQPLRSGLSFYACPHPQANQLQQRPPGGGQATLATSDGDSGPTGAAANDANATRGGSSGGGDGAVSGGDGAASSGVPRTLWTGDANALDSGTTGECTKTYFLS